MTFDEYQEISKQTAVYDPGVNALYYLGLGVAGESGEVAEKLKKVIRNHGGEITEEMRVDIKKEIGDVLWYLSQLAVELNLSFTDVAKTNIEKLQDRKSRGVIKSAGDNR